MGFRHLFCEKATMLKFISLFHLSIAISIKIENCGITRSCFTFPANCSLASTPVQAKPCVIASWTYDSDGFDMILYADRTTDAGDWSAVGFSKNGGMKEADLYVCKRMGEKQNFTTAYSPTETRPTEYQLNKGFAPGIVNQSLSYDMKSSGYYCQFTINETNTKEGQLFSYTKSENYDLLLATGVLKESWDLTYHSGRVNTGDKYSFFNGMPIEFIGGTAKLSPMIKAHAILMFLAWGIFVPLGLTFGGPMKKVKPESKVAGMATWFALHRGSVVLGFLLGLAGVIVIFIYYGGWNSTAGSHGIIGLTVMSMAVVNIILGIIRPEKEDPKRLKWNFGHFFFGYSPVVLAIATISLGFVSGIITDTDSGYTLLAIYTTSGGLFFGQNIMFFFYEQSQNKDRVKIFGIIYFVLWLGLAIGTFGYFLSLIF